MVRPTIVDVVLRTRVPLSPGRLQGSSGPAAKKCETYTAPACPGIVRPPPGPKRAARQPTP